MKEMKNSKFEIEEKFFNDFSNTLIWYTLLNTCILYFDYN